MKLLYRGNYCKKNSVGTGGFAPPTPSMSMRCSTPELSARGLGNYNNFSV